MRRSIALEGVDLGPTESLALARAKGLVSSLAKA
jgi:hypothetical protein